MRKNSGKWFSIILVLIFNLGPNYELARAEDVPSTKVNIILGLTETANLDFTPDARLSIGNESLISVEIHPEKRRLIFKGLKAGNTDCTVFDLAGEVKAKFLIYITATDQSNLLQRLNEFLGDIEGLEIGIKGGKVYLGGQIVVPTDIGRITTIIEMLGEKVLNLVELSPQTQLIVARKMQDELHAQEMRNVIVRVVNGFFWLEGEVENKELPAKALKIAETYLPASIEKLARFSSRFSKVKGVPIIRNFITVQEKSRPLEIPKLVKITVQFVELSKDYLRNFGFTWSPTMATGGAIKFGKDLNNSVVTGTQGVLSGSITNLFPKLASAKSAGHARTLQSGMLLVENNTKGVLTKGKTIPYNSGSGEFAKGMTAKGGFSMTIVPSIIADEKIKLDVGISVKSITGKADAPQELENSISTSVVVKSDESAAIGGVVIRELNVDYDRDPPGGSSVAAIGEGEEQAGEQATSIFSFIRSKSYATSKNQFVMFVTPKIIESASAGTEELQKKFRQRSR